MDLHQMRGGPHVALQIREGPPTRTPFQRHARCRVVRGERRVAGGAGGRLLAPGMEAEAMDMDCQDHR